MLTGLSASEAGRRPDLSAFRRQESIFIALNVVILSVLFSLHLYFADFWGKPSIPLITAVAAGILFKIAEWFWLRQLSEPLQTRPVVVLTAISITTNVALASVLAVLTNKEDTPYFVLMVVAVLEAAFRFRLPAILGVVVIVDVSLFWQVWWFYRAHPPLDVGEYFEAGIVSLLFAIVGVVVWLLLADARAKEERLAKNVLELERTREQLVREERLAVVGRLSSAIAHEIRNPVAMIASSIATARQLTGAEREEMFEIASEEANRLTQLTTEFLDYASTRPAKLCDTSLSDLVRYVADASRAYASEKHIQIESGIPAEIDVRADPGQLQQALMNLVMNAIEASAAQGAIAVNVRDTGTEIHVDVENSGAAIAEPALSQIFEPFFTTKTHGTGLGLAIARKIARAQGGDVVLAANEKNRIRFSLILPGVRSLPERRADLN